MGRLSVVFIFLGILLAGCSTGNEFTPFRTSIPIIPSASPLNATSTIPSPQLPAISPTPTISSTPTMIPIPIGGGNGTVLVSKLVPGELEDPNDASRGQVVSFDLILMDLNDPPGKVLVSKSQLEAKLNKQFLSVEFDPSPDKTKTVIYACTKIERSDGYKRFFDVYIASLDLESIVLIQTNMEQIQTHWNWSPDGTKLAGFINAPEQLTKSLRVINSDGGESGFELGKWETLDWEGPFWLPDSSRLSFTQWDELVELNLNDVNDNQRYKVGYFSGNLEYSPNGQKVAYLADPPYSATSFLSHSLVVANADFSNPLTIIQESSTYLFPTVLYWSSDSQYIVIQYDCVETESCDTNKTKAELIVKAENGEIISINMPNKAIRQFCGWSPDNQFVYILSDENGIPYLSLVDPAQLDSGESSFQIDFWGGMGCPIWLP